ncbi:MAG: glycosyltransferase family 2 protein [Candidatus Nanopelagicales bacterium]
MTAAGLVRARLAAPEPFLPTVIPLSTRGESRRLVLLAYVVLIAMAVWIFGVGAAFATIALVLNITFLLYFVRHMSFAISAARWTDDDLAAADVDLRGYSPDVLVVVAAHNEAHVVDGLVMSLLGLRYPHSRLRVLVVDDASTDFTGARLDQWQRQHPRLEVLHRAPGLGGGKSGALNDGIAHAGESAEIIVIFDADHEPEPSALLRVVRHFRDPMVGAVMGRCVVRNAAETRISSTVFVDYLSGYLVNEYGRQAVYELPAYGGANCAVRAAVLRHIGGFNLHSVTEDTDLTLRIVAGGGKVRYDPAAVDFEEAVRTARTYWKQRYRWARGHQRCARDYWRPVVLASGLRAPQKLEVLSFLFVYHTPVWVAAGIVLTLLRALGVGDEPPSLFLPLGMLLMVGPLSELAVGLVTGHTERSAAWRLLLFIPMFAMTVCVVTWAWIGGMLGLPYSWVKTTRSGAFSTISDQQTQDGELPERARLPETQASEMIIRTGGRRRLVHGDSKTTPDDTAPSSS